VRHFDQGQQTGLRQKLFCSFHILFLFGTQVLFGTQAFAARYGDIDVSVLPEPALEGTGEVNGVRGYFEYRIQVRNHSSSQSHQVQLRLRSEYGNSFAESLGRCTRTVDAAPGTSQTVSLFQPPLSLGTEYLEVLIDGSVQEVRISARNPLRSGFSFGGYSSASRYSVILVSRSVDQALKDDLTSLAAVVGFLRSELPVSGWSPNWLGYTSFSSVLLTADDLTSLTGETALALRRYVEMGGNLLVVDPENKMDQNLPAVLKAHHTLESGEDVPEGKTSVGFGQILRLEEADSWPASLLEVVRRRSPPSATYAPIYTIHRDSSIPVRSILTLIIVFAIGIGPVNIWLLSRWKKRMWLWWNVPLVSLATCLAVFMFSLFSEGVSSYSKNATFTLLDERVHRASTLGFASYYAPLTPFGGLHFSTETEVIPVRNDSRGGWAYLDGTQAKTIDWTTDQHLKSGWVEARVPVSFGVRKSETRRERLVVRSGADGKISIVNGLGADLAELYYMDRDGKYYSTENLVAGQEITLNPNKDQELPDTLRPVSRLYQQDWSQGMTSLQNSPRSFLRPGNYIAVVHGSPFLEKSLSGSIDEKSLAVIYGIGAGENDGN